MTDYRRELKPGEQQIIRRPPKSGKWKNRSVIELADGDTATITAGAVPPQSRVVQPGEDIAKVLESESVIELAAGEHGGFQVTGKAEIRRQPNAVVREGIHVTASGSLIAPSLAVRAANRAVSVFGHASIGELTVSETGTGILWRGAKANGYAGKVIGTADRMIRNVGENYGAMLVNFMETVANADGSPRIVVDFVDALGCRVRGPQTAPAVNYDGVFIGPPCAPGLSAQYIRDEGSVIEAFEAQGWAVNGGISDDSQVFLETGKRPTSTVNCGRFAIRNVLVVGTPSKADANDTAKGFKLRSAVNAVIEHVTVDAADHWAFNVEGGGTYGGSVEGLVIRSCVAFSPSALIRLGSYSGKWTYSHNAVAGTRVWGDVPAHGPAEADPFVDRARGDYALRAGSALRGAAHDGGDIGVTR